MDASIANVFATAALRMGHGLIQPVLHRLNASWQPIAEGPLLLQDAFFAPWRLMDEGGLDPILRGLFATPAKVTTATGRSLVTNAISQRASVDGKQTTRCGRRSSC